MAEYRYTLNFHESFNTYHDLPDAVTHDFSPLKQYSEGNVGVENQQVLILQPEEEIKRRRRIQSIMFSEKKRRIKMRQLLFTLQSLLPVSTTNKVERHYIIEETGKYIQTLQTKTLDLQKKKAHLLAATRSSSIDHNSSAIDRESISLNVCIAVYSSETVIIRITASRMPRSLCEMYEVVEAHALEIQNSDVYSGDSIVFLYIHATAIVGMHCHNSLEMTQIEQGLNKVLQNIY
ncbi:hypothetical protein SUGI_0728470 [Cryptomeria japonica]|uniref:uncharacterized protein LOC131039998 n=1 Tax=Cryptomeria japonica TaxID=3369 RepID=UPI0024149E37|nr:uncharacterized protein LOC131039998 [Cryptomeria japonica]XP_057828873.1 uncharacterized protein LOC131040017 [Cryptomeria japonica]GLJ36284.1 hypothetical protein SUGI_0728460 [Cryptomeria japonica]GLJ36285.1 hypothetical protein SUGI_0728470 [Cryptomeria japonica]